jgi:hypothetical protein
VATDKQVDEAAAAMHRSAQSLYHQFMNVSVCKDADIQAAALNGLLACAAVNLWHGREDGATSESVANAIREAVLDIMKQCEVRQRAQTN